MTAIDGNHWQGRIIFFLCFYSSHIVKASVELKEYIRISSSCLAPNVHIHVCVWKGADIIMVVFEIRIVYEFGNGPHRSLLLLSASMNGTSLCAWEACSVWSITFCAWITRLCWWIKLVLGERRAYDEWSMYMDLWSLQFLFIMFMNSSVIQAYLLAWFGCTHDCVNCIGAKLVICHCKFTFGFKRWPQN